MKTCMMTTIAVIGVVFLLGLTLSAAIAQPIADPVLYFNALETDQAKNDKVWRNAGTAGGEVPVAGKVPTLENGVIEIKSIGLKEEMAWYTPESSGSVFSNAAPGGKSPVANLEDFTMGILMKINGPMFAQEHHLLGLQAQPREQVQNIRIWLDSGGNGDFSSISIAQGAKGMRNDWPNGTHQIRLGEQEWHWVHLVFESGKSMTFYIDGEKVGKTGSNVKWSDKHDMSLHGIFSHSSAEQVRTCNCSIAIYRVYDSAFNFTEVDQNVRGSFAVEPADKLTTTWGKLKI